jgi:uncharacterized protein DUF3850
VKLHELKTWPEFFGEVWSGRKTLEVRLNDRGFCQGDILHLREKPRASDYTGKSIIALVTHVLDDVSCGMRDGYVAMSIKVLSRDGQSTKGDARE